jgi:sterol desaturase/sphingolipid hydroxylase (fatty acid hydroxylase superfamily)
MRLLFPPALAIVLVQFIFIPFFIQIIPTDLFYPMLSGGLCGFLLYDLTHFYLHHFEIKNNGSSLSKYKKNLKLHHMRHHFKDGTKAFGVSSKMWDILFNTQINF